MGLFRETRCSVRFDLRSVSLSVSVPFNTLVACHLSQDLGLIFSFKTQFYFTFLEQNSDTTIGTSDMVAFVRLLGAVLT